MFTDVKGPPTHRLSCGQSPYTETTTWERKYCILTDSQLVLLNREKEVREHTSAFRGNTGRQLSSPLSFFFFSFSCSQVESSVQMGELTSSVHVDGMACRVTKQLAQVLHRTKCVHLLLPA